MRFRSVLLTLLVLLCTAALSSLAVGATVLDVSLERLAERADRVVRGRVTGSSVFLEKGAQRIWTRYQVRVDETLVGKVAKSIVVHVPGGRIGERSQRVKGVAHMEKHDDVILFLWTDAAQRERVLGQSQGRYRISKDPKTGRLVCAAALDGLVLVREDGSSKSGQGRARRLELDLLKRRVAAARAAQQARLDAVRAQAERKRRAAAARAKLIRERTRGKPGNQ